ncbi:MoaD/ThiS family protein [Candidatus Bathyarchaeota archaeon]|nr:MoaD/ThiS family protein [Candidatus Bathyarchaeota archaeon]
MDIEIKLFGSINRIAGTKNFIFTLNEGSKIIDLINMLIQKAPKLKNELIDPIPKVLFILNGVEIKNLNGFETKIIGDSELILLSFTHGG